MTKVASSYAGIEVVPLKVKYPQGGEKQLIDAITKRQVASGALPISTGAVVQNVGTALPFMKLCRRINRCLSV